MNKWESGVLTVWTLAFGLSVGIEGRCEDDSDMGKTFWSDVTLLSTIYRMAVALVVDRRSVFVQ